jgi:chromosome segregation protein
LPDLRNAEVAAAAGLQRLIAARAELEAEEKRVKDRAAEIARRIVEIEKDIARESALSSDAAATIVRLAGEEAQLAKEAENEEERTFEAKAKLADAEGDLASEETALADVQSRLAALVARRDALKRAAGEAEERARRLGEERARVAAEFERLAGENGAAERLEALASEKAAAEELVAAAEAAAAKAREAAVKAREADAASRVPLAEAERHAQRLETEARTLAKLLAPAAEGAWNPVLDTIHARKGFETALGAALGEDLDAPADPAAPTHWVDTLARASDPALPEGVKPLSDVVKAPGVLLRRLNQIGVVAREDGPRLRSELVPGQRLVSREGDLWRWDGYTAAADAPSAAARRLAEKNRLGDLEKEAAEARLACERLKIEADAAQAAAKQAAARDTELFEAARAARAALDTARAALADAERQAAETASRRSALTEALARIAASESEAQAESETRATELAGLADPARFESDMLKLRALVAERRAVAAEARVVVQNLQRESENRARRRTALAAEREQWTQRADRAAAARADMETRLAAAIRERDELATAPDTFHQRRRALADEIAQAEARRSAAADKLAAAETAQAAADRAAREALDGLATAREARAGSEARLEAARTRLTDIVAAIADSLECGPNDLRERAGLAPEAETPSPETVENRLSSLRAERERLGGVNLRAEEELAEVEAKRNGLASERDDLTEAIRRLRQAIGNLNREGRERLLAAFEVVNAHFQRLFTTLFGGGTAELRLVDSEDPLEAGLEILARPPGKKPQVMTLLSGGEQALTATALIFAVFLTNPSPICVLDEVDAPLDDANVERYCDLLVEMARETDTRFIVITHNPITMARMDRLFGVTMAERGVSQLVSVDLATAERFQEAV